MNSPMTHKTQSVCTESPTKQHTFIEEECSYCGAPKPVSEPASTGEPELIATMIYNHDKQTVTVEWPAARPSEPCAPQTGYCPSHGEKLVPIFGGQWNGCPKCPRDADGFTPSVPQTSAEPQHETTDCLHDFGGYPMGTYKGHFYPSPQSVSDPAPSPTPSVSTEPQQYKHKPNCLWATPLPTGAGYWGCDCGLDNLLLDLEEYESPSVAGQ